MGRAVFLYAGLGADDHQLIFLVILWPKGVRVPAYQPIWRISTYTYLLQFYRKETLAVPCSHFSGWRHLGTGSLRAAA